VPYRDCTAGPDIGNRRFHLGDSDHLAAVHDFLDFPTVYVLLCTSRCALALFQELSLYEASARRRILIGTIPSYIGFRWRLPEEVAAIQSKLHSNTSAHAHGSGKLPEVPNPILEEAASVEISLSDSVPLRALRTSYPLTAMSLAKLTFSFAKGLDAYEAKRMGTSAQLLEVALALDPEDDVLLSRLGDTRYAQYQEFAMAAVEAKNRTEESQRLKDLSQQLYKQALSANPRSSYGFNGLALFQDCETTKRRYLLKAVALDNYNSYALVNLAMCLDSSDRYGTSLPDHQLALYQRALAINPNLFYARPAVVQLQLQLGQYSQAFDTLNEHVQRRPEDRRSRQLRDGIAVILQRDHTADLEI